MSSLLTAPARQARSLEETGHRPWPAPTRMWLMGQSWIDLLFAHWPVAASVLEPHVPEPLELEAFDGQAWIGITPFVVTGLRLAATPPLPALSTFPEVNVRTYVSHGGKPGIWFLSLDAASRAAVAAARRVYHLPYFHARMSVARNGGSIEYASARDDRRGHDARLAADYRPVGEPHPATQGTLEYFLTERYCLYSCPPGGRLLRAEIHHRPWPLQRAKAEIRTNTMVQPGLEIDAAAALFHFSQRQDVVVWSPERAD